MIKEVKLPDVSDNVETGDVLKVLVSVGDKINVDQPVIELETDKASFEVPSSESGIVKEINVKQGDIIKIGAVILKVETNGEEKTDDTASKVKIQDKKDEAQEKGAEGKTKAPDEAAETKTKIPEKEAEVKYEDNKTENVPSKEIDKADIVKPEFTIRENTLKNSAPASPSVRRLARELGADINSITGSGEGGRITEEDLKSFVKSQMNSGTGVSISHKPLPDFKKYGETEIQPMSKVRSVTAETMTNAWTSIPMVTQFDKADITRLEEFRKKNLKEKEAEGAHLTITSFLVKICETALRTFPQFNSSIDIQKKEVVYKKYFNIGVAVDTDRGLLVPVLRNVDKKTVTELSKELNELAEKARNKKITPDEMDGGNFTISNLGGIGGTSFTPIVYSPQVAILGVSRGNHEPRFINEKFEPRLMLPLSLTYDHRIIDGADAARFLRWICEVLEDPIKMVM